MEGIAQPCDHAFAIARLPGGGADHNTIAAVIAAVRATRPRAAVLPGEDPADRSLQVDARDRTTSPVAVGRAHGRGSDPPHPIAAVGSGMTHTRRHATRKAKAPRWSGSPSRRIIQFRSTVA